MKKLLILFTSVFMLSTTVIAADGDTFNNGDYKFTVLSDAERTVELTYYDCPYFGDDNITIPSQVYYKMTTYQVTSIGESAFYSPASYGLKGITIPNTITKIGSYAFRQCGLTSITIPSSVTEMGNNPFDLCIDLQNIVLLDDNKNFKALDGVLYNSSLTEIICYPCGKEDSTYEIPNSVTKIGWAAFANNHYLTSITIPNSVTEIGNCAFSFTNLLTSVTFPNSVTKIGPGAFISSGLSSVTLPNAITKIEDSTFMNCKCLSSIIIPGTVTEIGERAFSDCISLTSIYSLPINPPVIKMNVDIYDSHAFHNVSKQAVVYVPSGSKSKYFNDERWARCFDIFRNIDDAEDSAIYFDVDGIYYHVLQDGKSVEITNKSDNSYKGDIIMPERVTYNGNIYDVTSIGRDAFAHCYNLDSVVLPNSVTTIDYGAFYQCESLKSVEIPNSVIEIGDYAFFYCKSLTSVAIGNSVISIGEYAFEDCISLTSVKIGNSVASIGDCAFACTAVTSIEIPNSVTSIGNGAFLGCKSLTSVEIPNSVTSIGDVAFRMCESLISVIIPNSVTSIGESAFDYCSNLTSIYYNSDILVAGDDSIFDGDTYNQATLYLTEAGYAMSNDVSPWKNFIHKEIYNFSGIKNVEDVSNNEAVEYYNLNGVRSNSDALTPGLYIRKQGATSAKVLVK